MADTLTAISPDGTVGTIPADKEADWLGRGPDYRILHNTVPDPKIDLADDGKSLNVFFKGGETFTPGIVPVDKLHDPDFSRNFELASQRDQNLKYHDLMQQATNDINAVDSKSPTMSLDWESVMKNDIPESAKYEKLDIRTPDGKWKMERELPNGSVIKFLVPTDKLFDYYTAGARFQNKEYEALIDATYAKKYGGVSSDELPDSRSAGRRAEATTAGTLNTLAAGIPMYATKQAIQDPELDNFTRAQNLAQVAAYTGRSPQLSSSFGAGSVAGIPISLLAGGEGLFGEVGAGAKLGGAAEAFIAGEAPNAARAASAWAAGRAIEGAVIASPQAIAQAAIDKDLKGAGETLLLGAGINGALHLGSKGIKLATGALESSAVDRAVEELGGDKQMMDKLGPKEQQEGFLKKLADEGLTEKNTTAKAPEVLENLAKGGDLEKVAEKLEPYAEKMPAGELAVKMMAQAERASSLSEVAAEEFRKVGQAPLSEDIKPIMDKLSEDLSNLADKEGKISLPDLVKFARQVGDGVERGNETAVNLLQKAIHEDIMTTAISLGDSAAESAGPKIADQWGQAKFNTEISKQLTDRISQNIKVGNKAAGASNPVLKFLATALKHKLGHVIGGAAIGHAIGGPVGGVVGSVVGHAVVGKAVKMLEHMIINPENPSSLTRVLKSKGNSPALSSYMALDAVHSLANKLDKIQPYISNLGVKAGTERFSTNESPIKQILGKDGDGLNKNQQFAKLSTQLSLMAGNQDLRRQHITDMVAPFLQSHPALAQQMSSDLENKIQYLHQIMPKNPNPPKPFAKDDKWTPSPADLAEFEQHLKIAQNPFALLDKLKEGKVTEKEVATAMMLNPTIMTHIRNKMMEAAYSGKADLKYQQKLNASILMGQQMDESLNSIQQLQSVYGPNQQASAPAPPPKRSKGGSHVNAEHLPAAQGTTAQRLADGGRLVK